MDKQSWGGDMKAPAPLTARFVETVIEPGRYGDGRGGHGLILNVHRMGDGRISRSWIQRVMIADKPTHLGLGSFPVVTLAAARKVALRNKRMVFEGKDPRTGGVPTFAQAIDAVLDIQRGAWRDGGKSERQWRASLDTYAVPVLGRMTVDRFTSADVLAVVGPIWNTKRETARRVRQRIGAICKWAIAEGHRTDNPAGDALGAALPKNGATKTHHRALPYAAVSGALRVVAGSGAWWTTKSAFRFLVLTAARSGEVRGMRWAEVDFEAATWTVPGERMKTSREHRVPLSPAALDLLREAAEHRDGDLVFPSMRGKELSDTTISKLLLENNVGAVPHGFRSSFRDWCAERSNAPREVAEHALAHVEGSASELAYRRTDYFEHRRALMESWARYVTPESGKVECCVSVSRGDIVGGHGGPYLPDSTLLKR